MSLFSQVAPSIAETLNGVVEEKASTEVSQEKGVMSTDTPPKEEESFAVKYAMDIVGREPRVLEPVPKKSKTYKVELPEVDPLEIEAYLDAIEVEQGPITPPTTMGEMAGATASDVATARGEAGITQSRTEPANVYEIKKGDNLSKIAKANNTTVAAIVELNDIENPDIIVEGERLVMPDPVSPTANLETAGVMSRPEPVVEDAEVEEEPVAEEASTGEGSMSRMLDEKGKAPVVAGQTQGPESGIFAAAISPLILQDPEMSFIVQLESFREKPYELNSVALDPEKTHVSVNDTRSGLTVANGFDVGQHNKATLRNMGLSKQTIDKFGDWVGVNPDTIIDPNTGQPAANRRRGHELMADMYRRQENAGTLPSFTMRELEQISKGSYDVLGRQEAKRAYGEGWDDLDPDVQAVLIQDVYVRGSISGDMEDRARRGLPALEVLEGMQTGGDDTHLSHRKDSTRRWLTRNSMSDDTTTLGTAGSQMLANILAEELGLDLEPIAVDNRVGPATRARINTVLEEAGKEAPSRNSSGDAERRQLLEEVLEERLIALPEEE